jgi:hypothetical protein
MGPAVDSRTKATDAIIPTLQTEYEVMAVEHNSPIEYCYDANRHAFLFLDMSHDTLDFKAETSNAICKKYALVLDDCMENQ